MSILFLGILIGISCSIIYYFLQDHLINKGTSNIYKMLEDIPLNRWDIGGFKDRSIFIVYHNKDKWIRLANEESVCYPLWKIRTERGYIVRKINSKKAEKIFNKVICSRYANANVENCKVISLVK